MVERLELGRNYQYIEKNRLGGACEGNWCKVCCRTEGDERQGRKGSKSNGRRNSLRVDALSCNDGANPYDNSLLLNLNSFPHSTSSAR